MWNLPLQSLSSRCVDIDELLGWKVSLSICRDFDSRSWVHSGPKRYKNSNVTLFTSPKTCYYKFQIIWDSWVFSKRLRGFSTFKKTRSLSIENEFATKNEGFRLICLGRWTAWLRKPFESFWKDSRPVYVFSRSRFECSKFKAQQKFFEKLSWAHGKTL